jgi:hypothetical protein
MLLPLGRWPASPGNRSLLLLAAHYGAVGCWASIASSPESSKAESTEGAEAESKHTLTTIHTLIVMQ